MESNKSLINSHLKRHFTIGGIGRQFSDYPTTFWEEPDARIWEREKKNCLENNNKQWSTFRQNLSWKFFGSLTKKNIFSNPEGTCWNVRRSGTLQELPDAAKFHILEMSNLLFCFLRFHLLLSQNRQISTMVEVKFLQHLGLVPKNSVIFIRSITRMISKIFFPLFSWTSIKFCKRVQEKYSSTFDKFITVLQRDLYYVATIPEFLTPQKTLEIFFKLSQRSIETSSKLRKELKQALQGSRPNPGIIQELQDAERYM